MRVLWINLNEDAPSAKMNAACISDFAEDLCDAKFFLLSRHYEAVVFADLPFSGALQRMMRSIRENSPETALIGLALSESTEDEGTFLSAGGDDYIPYPRSLQSELVRLRIEKWGLCFFSDEKVRIGPLSIDPKEGSLFFGDERIELQPGSFRILHHLMLKRRAFLTKDQIASALFEDPEYVRGSTVETTVHTIRKRLDSRFGRVFIKTLRTKGYRFVYNSE
jgi:two-component system response regulator PhoP